MIDIIKFSNKNKMFHVEHSLLICDIRDQKGNHVVTLSIVF